MAVDMRVLPPLYVCRDVGTNCGLDYRSADRSTTTVFLSYSWVNLTSSASSLLGVACKFIPLLQALRVASDSMSKQGSFEAVLREADSAEALLKRRSQVGASPLLDVTLLSQPKVFTLAIVWESAKVSKPSYIQYN